jgi:hypothetical protein
MYYKYQLRDKAVLFLIEFTSLSKDTTINRLWHDHILMCRALIGKGYLTVTETELPEDRDVSLCRFTLTPQGILALAECVMYSDIDMLYDDSYRRQCKGQAASMLSVDFGYKGLRLPHHHPLLSTEAKGPRALVYFDHGIQCFTTRTFAGEIVECISIEEMRHYESSRMLKLHTVASQWRKQREQTNRVRVYGENSERFGRV